MQEPKYKTKIINNYELRYPYKWDRAQQINIENTDKIQWLFLIHYPSKKHYVFIDTMTEKELLKRVNYICFDANEIIDYINIYKFTNDRKNITYYGEFTYKGK